MPTTRVPSYSRSMLFQSISMPGPPDVRVTPSITAADRSLWIVTPSNFNFVGNVPQGSARLKAMLDIMRVLAGDKETTVFEAVIALPSGERFDSATYKAPDG